MLDLGVSGQIGCQLPSGFFQPESRAENRTERSFQGQLTVTAHATTSQSDVVQAHETCPVAGDECKGRGVQGELGPRSRHHVLPDPTMLVDAGIGPQDGKILDHDMPGQSAETGDFAVRTHPAIVPDMTRIHEQVPVADEGAASPVDRPQTDGHVLPDLVLAPDLKPCRLPGMVAMLGRTTETGMR